MNRYNSIPDQFKVMAGSGRNIRSISTGIENVPTGSKVATKFPWWEAGAANLPVTSVAGSRTKIDFDWNADFALVPSTNPRNAKNNRDFPIHVNEIGFGSNQVTLDDGSTVNLTAITSVKISTPKYQIISDFTPVQALQTQDNHLAHGQLSSYSFILPSPYYLQRGHVFKINHRCNSAMYAGDEINVVLRGYDPINKTPVVMSKSIDIPAVLSEKFVVVFDEAREASLRDMVITDIVWGFSEIDGATPRPIDISGYFEIEMVPPTGPRWTEAAWTTLAGIVEVTAARLNVAANPYGPKIVMRPPVPYILNPGDEVSVTIQAMVPNNNAVALPQFQCWLIGTQEG